MFAIPSFFGYNTTFVSTPVATAATGVGETSFTANWNAFAGAQYYLLDVSTSSSFSSFVLQDQVVYTNSYAVTGLTSNTTYYYRLRASTTYDTDAEAFFTRVSSAGGSLTTTEQQAVNSLVIQMKADGIWTAMKAIYPMVGGGTGSTAAREAACAQNLKSSSFTGTFTSGWTFASTGVTPNGTSAFMDTFFNPTTNGMSSSNGHLSVYNRSNITGTNKSLIGTFGITTEIAINFDGADVYAMFGTIPYPRFTQSDKRGFYSVSRDTATTVNNYFNGTVKVNGTSVGFPDLPNAKILLGVQGNPSGNRGNFSSNEQAFASIGDTLNSTQSANLYTAVQAFQTTLARQV